MASKYTEQFILLKLREIKAAITAAQNGFQRCEMSVGISLNTLRDVVLREASVDPAKLGDSIPRIRLHAVEWFSVDPAEALRLHDALHGLIVKQVPPPEAKSDKLHQ